MPVRGLWITLLSLASLAAKENEPTTLSMPADGFAAIHTLTLTAGAICRKLDRFDSPEPLAWHTKPAWQALYLEGVPTEKPAPNATACQRAISQRTLVGPLRKGTWQIYGASAKVGKILAYAQRREIKAENGVFLFTVEKAAVLAVEIHHFGNNTGRCREFVPMSLTLKPDQTIVVTLKPLPLQINEGGVCRAMPQTHANATLEIAPGSYKLTGATPQKVTLYAAE